MKNIVILIWYFTTTLFYGNNNVQANEIMEKERRDFPNLYSDIRGFIEKINSEHSRISKYFVYYLRVTKADSECIAYVLGFIINEFSFQLVSSDYYSMIDDNIIFVSFGNENMEKEIPGLEIANLSLNQKMALKDKLLGEGEGFIMGVFPAMVFLKCGNIVKKRYYENSDLIPPEKTIHKDFIKGIEMRKLKDGH